MYIDWSNILNFVFLITVGTLSGCLCVLFLAFGEVFE